MGFCVRGESSARQSSPVVPHESAPLLGMCSGAPILEHLGENTLHRPKVLRRAAVAFESSWKSIILLFPLSSCTCRTPKAASGHTHYSGFSVRSNGRGGGKGATGNTEAAFLAQSTLTPEELDGILKVPKDTICRYISCLWSVHANPWNDRKTRRIVGTPPQTALSWSTPMPPVSSLTDPPAVRRQ